MASQRYKLENMKTRPIVTYAIVIINIVVFLLMTFDGGSTNSETLVRYGAKFGPAIVGLGQYWRLITPIFLHIGLTHLVMNTLIVYFLGQELEGIYGSLRFAILYLLSGMMGNLASFAFNYAISAGASTSIFGMFASTIALGRQNPRNSYFQRLSQQYVALVVINFIFGLFSSGTDLMGHIGGFAGGYLMAYVVEKRPENQSKRFLAILLYLIVGAILFYLGFRKYT